MITAAERLDRLRLARTEGVGPITFARLLDRFGAAAPAIEALPALARAGGRADPVRVPSAAAAAREVEQVERFGAILLVFGEADYPPLLRQVADPPPVLAVQGDVGLLAHRAIGMVGARNASSNGRQLAQALAADIAARGYTVVSGLARGIDAACHAGALTTGRTVAAIAGGLDRPYPAENARLQATIAEAGAVLAEAPLGTAPQARHFPRRNRIIAGLSLATVVIEAAMRSGSLITARLAAENGRELFAVPGSPLDPRCRGSNDLIRQGAHLTESVDDVLDNLPRDVSPEAMHQRRPRSACMGGLSEDHRMFTMPVPESATELAAARATVLELLGPSPTPVDDLMRRCHLSPSAVIVVLLELELAGRVETLPGNRVSLLPGM